MTRFRLLSAAALLATAPAPLRAQDAGPLRAPSLAEARLVVALQEDGRLAAAAAPGARYRVYRNVGALAGGVGATAYLMSDCRRTLPCILLSPLAFLGGAVAGGIAGTLVGVVAEPRRPATP